IEELFICVLKSCLSQVLSKWAKKNGQQVQQYPQRFLAQIVLNHKEIALKIQQRKTLQFCEKKTTEKLLKHYIKLGS
ncbi:hypothetical protein D3G31_22135, partial [Escherichia coli]|nr:hypothetical protein [Escherichia coli]